jgi:hypothetical protein
VLVSEYAFAVRLKRQAPLDPGLRSPWVLLFATTGLREFVDEDLTSLLPRSRFIPTFVDDILFVQYCSCRCSINRRFPGSQVPVDCMHGQNCVFSRPYISCIPSQQDSNIRMGSMPAEVMQGHAQPRIESHNKPVSNGQANGADSFGPFNLNGLASSRPPSPTGMKDDIVLLSWLVVLLRTREDRQFACEWAYKSREHVGGDGLATMRLSAQEVIPDLHSKVGEVAATLSRNIATACAWPCTPTSGPELLLLSTGSLAPTPAGGEHEVSG